MPFYQPLEPQLITSFGLVDAPPFPVRTQITKTYKQMHCIEFRECYGHSLSLAIKLTSLIRACYNVPLSRQTRRFVLKARVERKTAICGSMKDSAGQNWGQNPEVSLGLVARVDVSSGISINSKTVAKEAQDFLRPYDHGTWDVACPLGLQKYGINLSLIQAMANAWTERAQTFYPDPSQVHLAFAPSPTIHLRHQQNKIRLRLAMPHRVAANILERFSHSFAPQIFPRDKTPTLGEMLFSTSRHPLSFYGEGAPHLVFHFSSPDTLAAVTQSPAPAAAENAIAQLLRRVTHAVSSADPEAGVFRTLIPLWSQGVLGIAHTLMLDGIEIASPDGISLAQSSTGHCQWECRLGFNATHDLRLPDLGSDDNRQIFGPCTDHPSHGHRWGLRLRFDLGFPDSQTEEKIPALQTMVHQLWQMLQGAHLNHLMANEHSIPATSETILFFIRDYFAKQNLHGVNIELYETPKNAFYWEPSFAS